MNQIEKNDEQLRQMDIHSDISFFAVFVHRSSVGAHRRSVYNCTRPTLVDIHFAIMHSSKVPDSNINHFPFISIFGPIWIGHLHY